MDKSIETLRQQRQSMQDMIEGTLDRKLSFLQYEKERLSYKLDESLYYLLQKVQEVDKGPDPVEFMTSLQSTNLVQPSDRLEESDNLFQNPPNTQQ